MRLSDVLSKAPDNTTFQVESFLGSRTIGWGKNKKIAVGRVALNYFCLKCEDNRTFMSGDELSCLITSEKVISVDASLRCPICMSSVETWFLVGSTEGFFTPAPYVFLERYTEQRRNSATRVRGYDSGFEDLLERAQLAYDHRLGAGSMVYLRQIFEAITMKVANAVDIPITTARGKRRQFKDLLEEVDRQHRIIPVEFSNNRYQLFSELSEVIHGDSNESDALRKYQPCRRLVLGIIDSVRNSGEIMMAIDSLGWGADGSTATTTTGEATA